MSDTEITTKFKIVRRDEAVVEFIKWSHHNVTHSDINKLLSDVSYFDRDVFSHEVFNLLEKAFLAGFSLAKKEKDEVFQPYY